MLTRELTDGQPTLEGTLAAIERRFGRRRTARERSIRREVDERMAAIKLTDPDPLGATPAERLAVDLDTPEGRRRYRRRARWLGRMRRTSARVAAEVETEIVVARAPRATPRDRRRPRSRRVRVGSGSRGSPGGDDPPRRELARRGTR